MVQRMRKKNGQVLNILEEAIKFVASTSAKCFTGVSLD